MQYLVYLVLTLVIVGVLYWAYKSGKLKSIENDLHLSTNVPNLSTTQPTVAPVTAPQTVTLPNTNQQVSSVTDAWLRSGAGYGRVDGPAPTGARDTSPLWTAFDGHANRASFQPNTPVTFSVNVGKPFVFSLSECPGTDPSATMTITATRNGSQVATISRHFGQAVDLSVPVGDAVLTAVSDKVTVADATIRQG